MRRLSLAVVLLAAAVPCHGQEEDRRPLPGAIWVFKAVDGEEELKGQFRVYRHELFKGNKKVGVVKAKDRNETTLVITDFPKLNGTSLLRRIRAKPPIWEGTLKRENGSTWKLTVEIKNSQDD